jgi:hypothetical protein
MFASSRASIKQYHENDLKSVETPAMLCKLEFEIFKTGVLSPQCNEEKHLCTLNNISNKPGKNKNVV